MRIDKSKTRLTQRPEVQRDNAPDKWESARFQAVSVTSSFFRSIETEETIYFSPLHT